MGFTELIPGVSGGTIALILGIYKRLIEAISNINLEKISWLNGDGNINELDGRSELSSKVSY